MNSVFSRRFWARRAESKIFFFEFYIYVYKNERDIDDEDRKMIDRLYVINIESVWIINLCSLYIINYISFDKLVFNERVIIRYRVLFDTVAMKKIRNVRR